MSKGIKILVLDVDGTLTDGKIYIGNNGEIFKAFHVKDGYALGTVLPELGIEPVILTARKSEIVQRRCEELGIKRYYQGEKNKFKKLCELAEEMHIAQSDEGVYEEIGYVGDDIPDLAAMKLCGFKACPKDAVKEIAEICDYVSKVEAGAGAVRDIVERIKVM